MQPGATASECVSSPLDVGSQVAVQNSRGCEEAGLWQGDQQLVWLTDKQRQRFQRCTATYKQDSVLVVLRYQSIKLHQIGGQSPENGAICSKK